jgi:hypothetical protein
MNSVISELSFASARVRSPFDLSTQGKELSLGQAPSARHPPERRLWELSSSGPLDDTYSGSYMSMHASRRCSSLRGVRPKCDTLHAFDRTLVQVTEAHFRGFHLFISRNHHAEPPTHPWILKGFSVHPGPTFPHLDSRNSFTPLRY